MGTRKVPVLDPDATAKSGGDGARAGGGARGACPEV